MARPLHHHAAIAAARWGRPVQRFWWRVRRPTVMGASAMVMNGEGQVLLVRHTYMTGWHFPGGGVATRETIIHALHRELMEEVGVTIIGEPALVGVYTNLADPRSSHVALYRIDQYEMNFRPNVEIAEWGFFAPDALPEGAGRGPRNRFAEMRGERTPDGEW